jgi:hypothetical protein
VYVASDRSQVSRDGGETWKPLEGLGVASRIAGRSADDIYALGFGLLHSIDRGKTWKHAPRFGRRCI